MKHLIMTIAIGVALFFLGDLNEMVMRPYREPEHVYCAGDRFICPDGTEVHRYPPDCEFGACPLSK